MSLLSRLTGGWSLRRVAAVAAVGGAAGAGIGISLHAARATAGCSISWTANAAGSWQTAANWTDSGSTHRLPGSGDVVCIGAFTVTYSSGTTAVAAILPATATVGADLALTGGELDVTGTATTSAVHTLSMTTGSPALGGAATLSALAGGTLQDFSLLGAGTLDVPSGATLTVSGASGTKLVDTHHLTVEGMLAWSGGDIGLQNAATLDIATGGGMDMQSDNTLERAGTAPLLTVEGTLTKSAGTGVSELDVPAVLTGQPVHLTTGTLRLSGGSNGSAETAPFIIDTGATLDLHAGAYTLAQPVSGAGLLQVSGAAVTASGTVSMTATPVSISAGTLHVGSTGNAYTATAGTTMTGGTLIVDAASTTGPLSMSGSNPVLEGTGTLQTTGTSTLQAFQLLQGGTLDVLPGSTLVMSGTGGKLIDTHHVVVESTLQWSGGDIHMANAAGIDVPVNAVMDMQSDSRLASSGTPPLLTVEGTLVKSAGTGVSELDAPVVLTGQPLHLTTGTLRLAGGSNGVSDTVPFTVDSGATLDLHAGTYGLSQPISGAGTLLSAATVNEASTVSMTAVPVAISGGTFTVSGAYTAPAGTTMTGGALVLQAESTTGPLSMSGSNPVLEGAATLHATGTSTLQAFQLLQAGTLDIPAGATLVVSGATGSQLLDAHHLSVEGTLQWTAGDILFQNGATIDIPGGGVLDMRSDNALGSAGTTAQLTVEGTVTKSAGSGSSVVAAPTAVTGTLHAASGTLEIDSLTCSGTDMIDPGATLVSATLDIAGGTTTLAAATSRLTSSGGISVDAGATLQGVGTITGSVTNTAGTVHPGLSPGVLTIVGTYTQQTSGRLAVDVVGAAAGSGYSQLAVTTGTGAAGTATLGGILAINTVGFFPVDAEQFTVVAAAGGRSGTFSTLTGGTVSDGHYTVQYAAKDAHLAFVQQSTAPSTTTLTTTPSGTSKQGQQVVITATVAPLSSPGTPTDSVTFSDGGTALATVALSGGIASITDGALSVGTHQLTAVYGGDATFATSTATATQTVVAVQGFVIYSRAAAPPSTDGTVWATATDGGYDEQITSGEWPRLSPNGRYLLFKRGGDSFTHGNTLVVRDLQTGAETSIFSSTDFVVGYDWTHDSSRIVFDSACSIDVMNRDGSGVASLVAGTDCFDDAPVVSPVDGRIAFHNEHSGIGLAAADGSGRAFIPATQAGDIWPAWSPDGTWISFLRTGNAGVDVGNAAGNVYRIHPDGTGLTQLTFLTASGDGFRAANPWLADGSGTVAPGVVGGAAGLYSVAGNGAGPQLLATTSGAALDFSGSVVGGAPLALGRATTTALRSSSPSSVFGQPVTFTATVTPAAGSGAPTGSVAFTDTTTGTFLGTVALSNGGTAAVTVSTLAVGSHTVHAVYSGDTAFVTSTGTVTQTVSKASTTTGVASSAASSVFGEPVTFVATVTAVTPSTATPTGSVTFSDGATPLGTTSLSSGVARLVVSTLGVGTHTITAVYAGDSGFNGSNGGNAVALTVSHASDTVAAASSRNPSTVGDAVTFTVTVQAVSPSTATPTGTVTVRDGSTLLGTATLSGGVAAVTVSNLGGGTHSITASYAGDSGFSAGGATLTQTVRTTRSVSRPGYRLIASDGGVFAYGAAPFLGSTGNLSLVAPIVSSAETASGAGYWLVASDGGVFAFGDAGFHGSAAGLHLAAPIVGMAATPSGAGYWLVASDGGIFAFGDAGFFGSTGALRLNRPVVGMAPAPDGRGYWLVASDGGIFAFGSARFLGSTGALRLNRPIVGMAASSDGSGYWLVASDGGIFAFGDAGFFGSTGAVRLNRPIVAMAAASDGGGYWLVASDGGVFAFGDAPFLGSAGGMTLNAPITTMSGQTLAAVPAG